VEAKNPSYYWIFHKISPLFILKKKVPSCLTQVFSNATLWGENHQTVSNHLKSIAKELQFEK
jgi:hypothetical protein